MNNILVSIIIPVYNGADFLRENIESVLRQTYQCLEIIYICDGCTDSTEGILNEYREDRRLKIIRNSINKGAACSRNFGLEYANGQWLIFLDADDIFEPNMIEAMLDKAQRENADICCCYYNYLDDDSKVNYKIMNWVPQLLIKSYPVMEVKKEENYLFQIGGNSPWDKLIHRDILRIDGAEIRFQNIPNANDVYFSMASLMQADRIVFVDKILLHYRKSCGKRSLSSQRNKRHNYYLEAMDAVYEFLERNKQDHGQLKISFYNKLLKELRDIQYGMNTEVYEKMIDELRAVYWEKWMMDKLQQKHMNSEMNWKLYELLRDNNEDIDSAAIQSDAIVKFISSFGDKKIALWGAGGAGKSVLNMLAKRGKSIDYVIDMDQRKWEKEIDGCRIYSYEMIKDKVEVIIVPNPVWYEDIVYVLREENKEVYSLMKEIEFSNI
ncbi:MAG: glycosyltransferase family 2 protein [Lachnospiraceae bacterium]|nr:glycosyltransferase family 2 protein [Lachnospiraceae bacterium]